MGSSESTPEAPAPLFEASWRNVNWGGKDDLRTLVKEFRPSTDEVAHVRILLYGPVGAGKSSFVNSVSTAVRGRPDIQAQANASKNNTKSFTVQYKTHYVPKGGQKEHYPFVLSDVMGLENGQGEGIRPDDIKLALNGHVKDGYKFNPVSSLSESNTLYYNPSPSLDDKVHLLVYVFSANSSEIKPSIIEKMKEMREAARDLGIPQVAIATHIDLACEEVQKDLKNVFRSKYLKQKMEEFSVQVGVPMNCIYPVKNYNLQVDNDDNMDTLILTALKYMLHYAEDFLERL